MTRTTVTTGAATAFVAQSAVLVAGAFWVGWRLGRFSASLASTQPTSVQQTAAPTLRIVNGGYPGRGGGGGGGGGATSESSLR